MNRPDRNKEEASPGDDRFWQTFAHAAGFDDELRDLIASGEIDAEQAFLSTFGSDEDLTANDLLAADRLHEMLLAARATTVELAAAERAARGSAETVARESRSRYGMLAALSLLTLASVAAVAAVVFFDNDGTGAGSANAEVASAERLAEEWVALREEALPRDVTVGAEIEFGGEPVVDAFDFEETPEWLVLAIAHQAELAADAVEEAAP